MPNLMDVLVTIDMPDSAGVDYELVSAIIEIDANSQAEAISEAAKAVEDRGLEGALWGVRMAPVSRPDLLPSETKIDGGLDALVDMFAERSKKAGPKR